MSRLALAAASLVLVSPPVLVDGPGVWTLPRLGYGTHARVLHGSEQVRLRFRLPGGALQGHGRWYVLRLHVRVEPDLGSLYGNALVHAATSRGDVCGDVFVHEERIGSAEVVSWQSGFAFVGTASRPALEGSVSSPCLYESLRGGPNELDVGEARLGAASFRSIVVYPDSGLFVARRVPPTPRRAGAVVTIEPLVPARPLRTGARLVLPFRIIRVGDVRTASFVRVRVRALGARVLASSRRLLLPGGQGAIVHGRAVLRALRPGLALLLVASGPTRMLVAWRVR